MLAFVVSIVCDALFEFAISDDACLFESEHAATDFNVDPAVLVGIVPEVVMIDGILWQDADMKA